MREDSYRRYLGSLSEAELGALLTVRSDIRLRSTPNGMRTLTQRLLAHDSLFQAVARTDRAAHLVGIAITALMPEATIPVMAALLRADETSVHRSVDDLRTLGLA